MSGSSTTIRIAWSGLANVAVCARSSAPELDAKASFRSSRVRKLRIASPSGLSSGSVGARGKNRASTRPGSRRARSRCGPNQHARNVSVDMSLRRRRTTMRCINRFPFGRGVGVTAQHDGGVSRRSTRRLSHQGDSGGGPHANVRRSCRLEIAGHGRCRTVQCAGPLTRIREVVGRSCTARCLRTANVYQSR